MPSLCPSHAGRSPWLAHLPRMRCDTRFCHAFNALSLADPASPRVLELLWAFHLVDPAPFPHLAHRHLGPREFEGNAAAAASELGVDVADQASSELHLASLRDFLQ